MPRFSIVIPVYNGLPYLTECLDGLLAQSFSDFEAICVEDCSTDESLETLKQYASQDNRIVIIEHPENRGSARARRKGVLASTGDYVLFSDQDDEYAPNALLAIDEALKRNPVSMFQYGVKVVNDGGVPQWDIDESQGWMIPYKGKLNGRNIVDGCFAHNLFSYSVWNKAYEGTMARKAFRCVEDVPVPLGEDNYASFVLAYFSDTFASTQKQLYVYHYGRGYTGNRQMSVRAYTRTCGLAVAAQLIERFLVDQGFYADFADTCYAARVHMLDYCLSIWELQIAERDRVNAFRELLRQWPYQEVLAAVSKRMPWALEYLIEARFGDMTTFEPQSAVEERLAQMWSQLSKVSKSHREMRDEITEVKSRYECSKAFKRGNALVRSIKREWRH